jgi:hypothetical protein
MSGRNAYRPTVPDALRADPALRDLLLTYFLETYNGTELTDWLRDLDQDTKGGITEKQQRIRAHTKYLSMPAAEFPAQTEAYLKPYSSDLLADLCEDLGISADGTKDRRYRRIMREVHYREGWLTRLHPDVATLPTAGDVMPVLGWFPIPNCGDYERDYYPVIHDELCEVFGDDRVAEELAVGHGSSILKIDFHVGDSSGKGVGIEVKMPSTMADVQRALGQLSQYQSHYGTELVLLVLQDFLKPETLRFFQDELARREVRTVIR